MPTVAVINLAFYILTAATKALTQNCASTFARLPSTPAPLSCSCLGTSYNTTLAVSNSPIRPTIQSLDIFNWFETTPLAAPAPYTPLVCSNTPRPCVLSHPTGALPGASDPKTHIKRSACTQSNAHRPSTPGKRRAWVQQLTTAIARCAWYSPTRVYPHTGRLPSTTDTPNATNPSQTRPPCKTREPLSALRCRVLCWPLGTTTP